MILSQIKYLLKAHTGMHIETVGDSILNTAIQKRIRSLDITDTASYLVLLQGSSAELIELTEEVVIPETWFFRDRHPFDMLGNLASTALSENSSLHWRILSVPSSTGEEPYSIAMTLLMAGMNPDQFSIEAIDISHRALDRAKDGHYGQHSFRGVQDVQVRKRFFDKTEKDYIIKPEIKELVNFKQANILEKGFRNQPGYDIIFCRNLLIYFDSNGKKVAYDALHHLLNRNGILFIGHSESGAIPKCFIHTRHERAFAYRKNTESQEAPSSSYTELLDTVKKQSVRPEQSDSLSPASPPVDNLQATKQGANNPEKPLKSEPELKPDCESPIELARKYADAGNLVDAEHICQVYLGENGQSATAHCLLGLIQEANNHPEEAEKSYRKAVYLDPHYTDALIQLALLMDKQGKTQQAQQLRQRASKRQEQSA